MAPRAALATAVALATVAIANLWVGLRLPVLLQETTVSEVLELERRAAAFPRASARVLVLGNSHALAGLRPAALARALGLGPDGVFSLALPSSSPQEMRLLLERHLAAFPNVDRVLCGVDEYFLGAYQELRSRYLTAGDLAERSRWVADQPLELRLRLLAGTWLPILDFGSTLHAAATQRPKHTLRGLFQDVPSVDPYKVRTAAVDHRWGYPPPWEQQPARALRRHALRERAPDGLERRARHFLGHLGRVPIGAGEVGLLHARLAARGIGLVAVEMPYTAALAATMRRLAPEAAAGWRAALDGLPAAERPPRVPAPALATDLFYDGDHLAPAGAEALARHVARHLPAGGAQNRK